MDWRIATVGMLVASVLLVSASAKPFDLSGYPEYCRANQIEQYCGDVQYDALIEAASAGTLDSVFVNEVAYTDEVVYDGPLRITSIIVDADIGSPLVNVNAVYKVKNTDSSSVTATLMARRAPENIEVYDGGSEAPLNDLHAWQSVFSPGQEKEIKMLFTEGVLESVYSYNTNLMLDNLIPANQRTPTGTFTFTFPEGTIPGTCAPTETKTAVKDGRVKIIWMKADFIPWTNPFNDLICNWFPTPEGMDLTAGAVVSPPATPAPTAQTGGDNTMLIVIVVIVALIAAIFLNSRRKLAAKPAARPSRSRK